MQVWSLCLGIYLDVPNPQTWQFEKPLEVHIGSRIREHRAKYGDVLQDRFRLPQNTRAACRIVIRTHPPNERIEDFQCEIALGKTHVVLDTGERARMLLAKFGVKIGFCLLRESLFRFLRN